MKPEDSPAVRRLVAAFKGKVVKVKKGNMAQVAEQQEKKEKPSYAPGERSIKDIIADLSKPIAPTMLKTKIMGKGAQAKEVTYLPWYRAVKYLDVYAPGWTFEIRNIYATANNVITVGRVTIPAAEGLFFREATGIEDEDKSGYGDAASNSESMCLRRAASKFGLCLYLYEK